MFCPNCGAQNADNVTFCASCGASMGAQQPVVQQPVYQAPAQPQQPVYQQPVYQQPVYQQPPVPGKGMGIASMVVGIVSLVFLCIWYIAIPCAIIGVILGGISASKAKQVGRKNGTATAGIVCSCIALGLAILFVVLVAVGAAELVAFANSYSYY